MSSLGVRIESGKLQSSGSLHDAQSRRETVLFVLACVLATIPVWIASYPPMVDLPQHAAQVALLQNLHDPNFRFAGLFYLNWFTPYLFGYMAVYALAPLLGIVAACKFVVSAALAGLPLGTALLIKETGAERRWALLTVPAMYGFIYEWGFLNFLAGAPIGLVFLALAMRHIRKPGWASSIWLGLFAVLLFFCHALILGFFGLSACLLIMAEAGSLKKALVAILPLASVLPLVVIWYLRIQSQPGAHTPIVWDLSWVAPRSDVYYLGGRVSGFFPRLLGMEANPICLIMGASLFVLPLLAGARPAKRLAAWIPLALCVIVLLFSPRSAFGSCIFQRFTVFALPFFLIGMKPSGKARPVFFAAAVILIAGWMAILTARTLRYDSDARDFNQILSRMDSNERAMSLIFSAKTDSFPAAVFLHFPAWYSAVKEGVVDYNFAVGLQLLVQYKPSEVPAVSESFSWHPQTFTWDGMHGGDYRYFVVHAPADYGRALFGRAPCRVWLAAHSNLWWLYEKDPNCSSSPRF